MMTRRQARNVWAASMLALLVATIVAAQFARGTREDINLQQMALTHSRQELENAARLSTALAQLDQLTIDENTATRLEILRHLGLEQTDYDIDITGRQQQTVSNATLISRNVRVTAQLTYAAALSLADRLYNTGKMVVTGLTLEPADNLHPNAEVKVEIEGNLYGLNKQAGGHP